MNDDPLQQIEADASARGVTLADVLKKAEIAPSTFWRWRKGTFEPRASTIRKLRQSLNDLADAAA